MIQVNGLRKSFGDKSILSNLSLNLEKGLNFVVGASGSGKTTLLKILSGIDNDYEGEVLFKGEDIKKYNQQQLNSYYYNSVGFIWQNFNLIEYMTVEENIEFVLNIGNESEEIIKSKIKNTLNKLGIQNLAKSKVNTLSGGQKQRVAIARVLVKDPEVIIADEPTGALDKKAAKVTMDILKKISKEKLVLVVTHDKSLIDDDSNVYELYKGTFKVDSNNEIKTYKNESKSNKKYINPKLSINRGLNYSFKSFKGKLFKNILTAIIIALASIFIMVKLSGEVVNTQQKKVDELVAQRGDRLRDIMIASNKLNTFGSDENTAFTQDVSEYLYKYNDDERIEQFLLVQFINGIKLDIDGITDDFEVNCMSAVPVFDGLVEGKLPRLKGREVAISKALVDRLGLNPSDVIGKNINLRAWTYDEGDIPRSKVDLNLENIKIVGVVDSFINLKNEFGQKVKTSREDTMFFSLEVVNEIKNTIKSKENNISFSMRVKDIKDVMPIVEELNNAGIIVTGEFESVKDILKISDISTGGIDTITSALAIIGVIAALIVSFINSYLRKYEYAVSKINGYSNGSLLKLNLFDGLILTIASLIAVACLFIPLNTFVFSNFNIEFTGFRAGILAIVVVVLVNLISILINYITSSLTDISKSLMTGDR